MYKIISVVGARPQFIKAASLSRSISKNTRLQELLVHSGQHYDYDLSSQFFEELSIPKPKYNLGIGSDTHNRQIGNFLIKFDEILSIENPDAVVVFGDTNTTAAAAIAAAKRNICIAHVEAGLREWNKAIPEEINKLLTDSVTDLYFSPTQTGVDNLEKQGISSQVFLTGDISLDLLYGDKTKYLEISILAERFPISDPYIFMTCHRDRNTDIASNLEQILKACADLEYNIVFAVHPRTKKAIQNYGFNRLVSSNMYLTDPLSFWESQTLLKNATFVITDSGGIIKEAYFHRTPCIIIDQQTEWLEAVQEGWAVVCGPSKKKIISAVSYFGTPSTHSNALGNGTCGGQIVSHLIDYLDSKSI